MSHLSFEQQIRVVACLVEGNSIRSTERLCGIHRDTILRHLLTIGEGCNRLHDILMMELHCNLLELDEVWGYIGKKQKRVKPEDSSEFGDQYVFTAIDATRKAIVSYAVGKRDGFTAEAFAYDLRARVVNRPQISTDGFKPYLEAIRNAFGDGADYAMVFKEYGKADGEDEHKYSPPRCIAVEKRRICGSPDMEKANTSFAERSNLTLRMGCRRFTRLTNCYSKKLANHVAAVGLHHAYYNFCRVHESLEKRTPGMAVGATDHVFSLAELIDAALCLMPREPPPRTRQPVPAALPPVAPQQLPPVTPILPAYVREAGERGRAERVSQAIAVIKQLTLFPESIITASQDAKKATG